MGAANPQMLFIHIASALAVAVNPTFPLQLAHVHVAVHLKELDKNGGTKLKRPLVATFVHSLILFCVVLHVHRVALPVMAQDGVKHPQIYVEIAVQALALSFRSVHFLHVAVSFLSIKTVGDKQHRRSAAGIVRQQVPFFHTERLPHAALPAVRSSPFNLPVMFAEHAVQRSPMTAAAPAIVSAFQTLVLLTAHPISQNVFHPPTILLVLPVKAATAAVPLAGVHGTTILCQTAVPVAVPVALLKLLAEINPAARLVLGRVTIKPPPMSAAVAVPPEK